jgi:hypothetical protein
MNLKRYTVTVQWLHINSQTRYSLKSKTMKLWAKDLMAASREALSQFQDKINPSISQIWADWPQPIQGNT